MPATSAPKTRDEASKEDGPATTSGEECLSVCQAHRHDEGVSPPPQHERAAAEAACPVADLVADYSTEDAQGHRVSKVQNPFMDQRPSSYQDSLTRKRHPGALECHAEEENQVTVPPDQVQQISQVLHEAATAFTARLTSTARISSEASACTIMRTFARLLRKPVSVGLKAVLVLKARKR